MKRLFSLALVLVLCCACCFAEDWESSPMVVNELIPDNSSWGLSREDFSGESAFELTECSVGDKKAMKAENIDVDGYSMDAYYVFDEKMWDETGYTFKGLSKVTYILSGTDQKSDEELNRCYKYLVNRMKEAEGEPETEKSSVTSWENDKYKIEIGKGKFVKYTGSDNKNLAVVITALDIEKPEVTSQESKEDSKPQEKKSNNSGALHMTEGTVLMNQNGIVVTLTGNHDGTTFLNLEAIVENNSSDHIGVSLDDCNINGWEVWSSGISDINPGKKKKGKFSIKIADAEISRFEEIETMEMVLRVYNGDTYRTMFETNTIKLVQ